MDEKFPRPQEHNDDSLIEEAISQDEMPNDISFFESTIFPSGTLTDALTSRVTPREILTPEEEDKILDAKRILPELIAELEGRGFDLRAMLRENEKDVIEATVIYAMLKNKILEYIKFIAGKASEFFYARHFKRAEDEFQAVLEYLKRSHGLDDVETLKIQMDYELSKLHINHFENTASLEDVIKRLDQKLLESPISNDTKKAIAIGKYALAQCYFESGDFSRAMQHIERSKILREEYGVCEEALDRIRFFYAKVANKEGDYPKAWEALQECYIFRRSKDELNPNLIAVLMELDNYFELAPRNFDNVATHLRILTHLYNIQVHIQYSEREETRTQLKMLKLMMTSTSETEYWSLMRRIEIQLNSISITEPSVEVGYSYFELANTRRSSLLPQTWSNVRKRAYHFETVDIINKAKVHLLTGYSPDSEIFRNLDNLREICRKVADIYKDPTVHYLIGEKLHPEDEAELAALNISDESQSESSTERGLRKLSEFSSEVNHELVDDLDRLLTVEDFEQLDEKGVINPYRLRLAQGGINSEFRDGKSLEETRQSLIIDPRNTSEIPPVEIGCYNGKIYSFDTRRVVVHQQAREENQNVFIRYKKISGEDLQKRVNAIFSPRPWNGAVTAIRYGGKNSESRPYINPPLRDQLEKKVSQDFKPFPSTRSPSDDPNGFPTRKKQAQKIRFFFQDRANRGSKSCREVLKKAKQIYDTEGVDAMRDFFISQKPDLLNQEEKYTCSEIKLEKENSKKFSQPHKSKQKKISEALPSLRSQGISQRQNAVPRSNAVEQEEARMSLSVSMNYTSKSSSSGAERGNSSQSPSFFRGESSVAKPTSVPRDGESTAFSQTEAATPWNGSNRANLAANAPPVSRGGRGNARSNYSGRVFSGGGQSSAPNFTSTSRGRGHSSAPNPAPASGGRGHSSAPNPVPAPGGRGATAPSAGRGRSKW